MIVFVYRLEKSVGGSQIVLINVCQISINMTQATSGTSIDGSNVSAKGRRYHSGETNKSPKTPANLEKPIEYFCQSYCKKQRKKPTHFLVLLTWA